MVFQCINIRQVSWEVLKTAAFGLGFQHLPRDLANVYAWKTMFDPYINRPNWPVAMIFMFKIISISQWYNLSIAVKKSSIPREVGIRLPLQIVPICKVNVNLQIL